MSLPLGTESQSDWETPIDSTKYMVPLSFTLTSKDILCYLLKMTLSLNKWWYSENDSIYIGVVVL